MTIDNYVIVRNQILTDNIFHLTVNAPEIARNSQPGQFCNIKVSETVIPLLRRPFSISDVSGDEISFMISITGEGTKILSRKSTGDRINILGPLGHGFNFTENYDVAVIVSGGIGIAPFPFLIRKLKDHGKEIIAFNGARTSKELIKLNGVKEIFSTDDGSEGFSGNVIELLHNQKEIFDGKAVKIFGCGPHPMLKGLKEFCAGEKINCEISIESNMACGFGICQGCPVHSAKEDKYYLICKDGPVFNSEEIEL